MRPNSNISTLLWEKIIEPDNLDIDQGLIHILEKLTDSFEILLKSSRDEVSNKKWPTC